MRFEKIKIKNFRNILTLDLELKSRVNVFYGENAQGKTNLLESLYTLTHGKSFRTPDVENLVMESSPMASVQANIFKKGLSHKIQMGLTAESKSLFLNEKKVSSRQLLKTFSSVLFSPESLSVIKDSDKERRDLIDEIFCSVYPEKSHIVDDFHKALKQRNRLLKDLRDGEIEINRENTLFLESLTLNYLRIAAQLCHWRLASLALLQPFLREALHYIFQSQNVDISVEYVVSAQKILSSDEKPLFDAMYKRWGELKTAEIKSGHSLVGPHKHDIRILLNGKDSRYYSSQGQQRLVILAFKMAQIGLHYRVHEVYPILLLDDVLSEIDERKRVRLIEYLEKTNAQIFLTTTENTVVNYLNGESLAVYHVEKGVLSGDIPQQQEGAREDLSVGQYGTE